MQLTPSAHVDTFCRDNLPPADQWPELLFDLPDVQYPDRLNCATELLDRDDRAARRGPAVRRFPDRVRGRYGDLLQQGEPGRAPARRRARRRAGQPRAAARPEQPVAGRLLVRGAQGRRGRGDHDAAAAAGRARGPSPRSPRSTSRSATTGSSTTWSTPASLACASSRTAASPPTTSPARRRPDR